MFPLLRSPDLKTILIIDINDVLLHFKVVPWIALVRRGRCNFDDKLEAAVLNNASGLVVYNNKEDGLQRMTLRNKYRKWNTFVFFPPSLSLSMRPHPQTLRLA